MRIRRWIAPILTLAAACQPAAPATLTEQDKATITRMAADFVQATNAHDWAKATDPLFASDAVRLPPGGPEVSGPSNIKTWLAAYPLYSDFATRAVEMEGGDGWAWVRGRYTIKIGATAGAPMLPDSGKFMEVWKKEPDGSWRLYRDIWNSDVPAQTPAPTDTKGASAKR